MTHAGGEPAVDSVEPARWERAAALFVRWREGESRAMDELVRLMTPPLWHIVRAYGLDAALAQDVVQTTWLTLVRRHESILDPQAVSGWLTMCARREAWRVSKLHRRADPTDVETLEPRLPVHESAEETAATDDESRRLWIAVATLNERCQRLLRIVAFEDRPDYARIAEDSRCRSARSDRRASVVSQNSAPYSRAADGEGMTMETEDFGADAALFARMRSVWEEVDPAPADLVDRMVAAVAVEDLSREYALLTLVEGSTLSAVRGVTDTATLQFSDGETSVLLHVTATEEGSRRVDGWVDAAALAIRLVQGDREWTAEPGEHGRFAFDPSPPASRGCDSSSAAPTATCTNSRPRSSKCDQRRAVTDVWRAVRDEERP